ncbi:MAG: putative lipid II flippase MurJ [Gemmatimonadaceae bacterium]|nr:putative lipid II flippase MurJ [Gemmatimonadaceae bacterium]
MSLERLPAGDRMTREAGRASGRGAVLVAAGILASRIAGLIRQRVFAHYFGTTFVADAFSQAFRIPNLLQNLFGEGVLSASFIPVYSGLRARGDDLERERVASAVFWLLAMACGVVVAIGIGAAPWLTRAIAPGFTGYKLQLTTQLVRILFPGSALLVLSAWSLGIQNSHGRFFLSYASAIVWNVAMIGTLVLAGPRVQLPELAVWLAWGSVVGAALQLIAQLPVVLALLGTFRVTLARGSPHVRTILRNFGPAFIGRGVAQFSAFVDAMIASLLVDGAVATLNYAQLLYLLPISLFGMSISAAELPAMSSVRAVSDDAAGILRERLRVNLSRMAYFVVPSAAAFVGLGDLLARIVYQTGRFDAEDARWVWVCLGGSAVGLVAATFGRLLSSTFYALHDTRTPLRYAIVRVTLTVSLGLVSALWLPGVLRLDPRWGVAGLTASAGAAAWVEFALLRRALQSRIGAVSLDAARLPALWACAALAAGLAWIPRLTVGASPIGQAAVAIVIFGSSYLTLTHLAGFAFARSVWDRLRRRQSA